MYDMENNNLFETPYYALDEEELQRNICNLKSALNNFWNNYIIGYSLKTNSLPWLVNYFRDNDFFAEVVSDDEYALAKGLGYEISKIIYNGPLKSKGTFLEAVTNNCIVNVDNYREIDWLRDLDKNLSICNSSLQYDIGVRINFDLESQCPGETVSGNNGSRFGFCYENGELEKVINIINSFKNIKLSGVHIHYSTKTRSLNVYKAISGAICSIKKHYGLNLKYIDIGGGFFGGLYDKPQFNDYFKVISDELRKEFDKDKTILIVEPGTSLVSSPFKFYTTVVDVKQTITNTFIVTDGSRINVDPLMTKSKYFYSIESKRDKPVVQSQVISGFTCMENDRLFVLENHPLLSVGDKIIYEKVGAYTMCLSPLFIKYFPPVYLKRDNKMYLIKDKWSYMEYIQKSKIKAGLLPCEDAL